MSNFDKDYICRGRYKWIIPLLIFLTIISYCWIMKRGVVGPTWNNITVGQSTSDEVILQLGQPTKIENLQGRDVYYYQCGEQMHAQHRIVVQGNIVEEIEEDMSVYQPKITHLTEIIETYGKPDYVVWSQQSLTRRVAIFLDEGILVFATALPISESEVIAIVYYRPCSLPCVQLRFSQVLSFVNPSPDSDVVGPRNPWDFYEILH